MNKIHFRKTKRSKAFLSNHLYREAIGNHTNFQDKRQLGAKYQNDKIQALAEQPGLHTHNFYKRKMAYAMVQLLAILGSINGAECKPISSRPKSGKFFTEVTTMQSAFVSSNLNLAKPRGLSQDSLTNKDLFYKSPSKYSSFVTYSPSKIPDISVFKYRDMQFDISANTLSNDFKNIYKSSGARKKRNLLKLNDIPSQLYALKKKLPIGSELRAVFDIVLAKVLNPPEVLQAHDIDKNLYALVECIGNIYCFVKKKNLYGNDWGLLEGLIEIADNINTEGKNDHIQTLHEEMLLDSISKEENFCYKSTIDTPLEKQKLFYQEQNKRVNKFIQKKLLTSTDLSSLCLVNTIVRYLSLDKNGERLRATARSLLKGKNLYGSHKSEYISEKRQMTIVTQYLSHQILGESLYEWLAKNLERTKLKNVKAVYNSDLGIWLSKKLNNTVDNCTLTPNARLFYKENVQEKLLPTLTLSFLTEEMSELNNLDVTQPRWGFIHAGALLMLDSGCSFESLTLVDFEDAGMALSAMIVQNGMPKSYAQYFTLPALLYGTSSKFVKNLSLVRDSDMTEIFNFYFEYIKKWEITNNPIIKLPNLIRDWKERSDLAEKILNTNGLNPNEWLASYLNSHSEKKIGKITLPNIDDIFEKQNHKLADATYEIYKLIFSQALTGLSEDEQQFIQRSQVDRVRVLFNARGSIKGVPRGRLINMGMEYASALKYYIPDHIDMLTCRVKEIEHIYVLELSKLDGKYELRKIDRDRELLIDLLDDSSVPKRDSDYKVEISWDYRLKEPTDSVQELVQNLSEYHRDKLFKSLQTKGYNKTNQEKIKDFLLNLIPFYTCINENMNGNERGAIPACIVDILSIVPFVGKSIQIGSRFGTMLGGTTVMALRYGAREASIKQILYQTTQKLIDKSPLIAEEISPHITWQMGSEFLNGIDPGLGPLISGGLKGVKAMESILSKLTYKSTAITNLLGALKKNNAHLSSIPEIENIKIESAFSPAHGKILDVSVVGEENGKKILAQVNSETGEFFGEKFIQNNDGSLIVVDVKLRHKNREQKLNLKPQKLSEAVNIPLSKNKPGKVSIIELNSRSYVGQVVKCEIPNSNYVHYYAKFHNNEKGSEILVLSAHGGFYNVDMTAPVVVLPSDITIKMLAPHGTKLMDPGLDRFINHGHDLRAYVTITNSRVDSINFLPQTGNPNWKFSDNYNPKSNINVLGNEGGLQNYRHVHYEFESEELISKVLIKNKYLANLNRAPLTDILTVRSEVDNFKDISLQEASVQRVIDLDKAGLLLNGKGERYKEIVFSHCRMNLFEHDDKISSYVIDPWRLQSQWPKSVLEHSVTDKIGMTILHRDDVTKEFKIKYYTIGSFIFLPVKNDIETP